MNCPTCRTHDESVTCIEWDDRRVASGVLVEVGHPTRDDGGEHWYEIQAACSEHGVLVGPDPAFADRWLAAQSAAREHARNVHEFVCTWSGWSP